MSFSKNDLELIKSKIVLSQEIEKKTKIIKKGRDSWCCCPFHEEKTPSCKINDELGSYYCFGCGAKGDIFTIYTDLYNFSFPDAVKELSQRVGVRIVDNYDSNINKKNEKIYNILELSAKWFQNNLNENNTCKEYLKKRNLSDETVLYFKLGYSSNSKTTLYDFLKEQNFNDKEILESNVVKLDKNNKIRDFFYKRLIFPIADEYGKIVGFGGRVLDDSNPKYINSPESNFFKKRNILYNLYNAKQTIRSKKNILICEGYMDVISLYEKKIKTGVAPLGTALTDSQLLLSWKYVNKPTIMFDGDESGLRASLKTALMALQYVSPNKYLQFIKLPKNDDPDSFINKNSLQNFVSLLKNPLSLVSFIFEQSSNSINFDNADNRITFDKYIDDIVDTIKDKKIKYFYKNEFKNLFFQKLKSNKSALNLNTKMELKESLVEKQIISFFASYINHKSIRDSIAKNLLESELLNENMLSFFNFLNDPKNNILSFEDLYLVKNLPIDFTTFLKKLKDSSLFQLFPYAKNDYNSDQALKEITESIKNLNTRLSNLKKINKSLDKLDDNLSSIEWEELKKLSSNVQID